jgi:hypothetical protein
MLELERAEREAVEWSWQYGGIGFDVAWNWGEVNDCNGDVSTTTDWFSYFCAIMFPSWLSFSSG